MTWKKWAKKLFCCSAGTEEISVHPENHLVRNVHETGIKISSSLATNIACGDQYVDYQYDECSAEEAKFLDIFVKALAAHIRIGMREDELCDIYKSVEETVSYLLNKLEKVEPVLKHSELIPTGSCYDGTKILEPNEFDFLAVMDCLSVSNIAVASPAGKCAAGGFAHAIYTDKHSWSHIIDSDGENSVVACRKSKSLRELFRERFHAVILAEISDTFSLKMHTGSLFLNGFSVSINGPQCSVRALWQSKNFNSEPLEIDIDVSPAIKCSDISSVLNRSDAINEVVYELILQEDFFYLIPRPHPVCNKCFKMVFAQSDQRLVKDLNASHTKVFMILKYLSHEMLKHNFRLKKIFNSFALKMAVFHHSFNCYRTDDSVGECLLSTVIFIQEQLDRDPPTMPSVFTINRNVWKTVDLAKQELSLAHDILNNLVKVFDNTMCGNFRTYTFDRLKDELLNACSYSISLGSPSGR